jgi:hypothetical protein
MQNLLYQNGLRSNQIRPIGSETRPNLFGFLAQHYNVRIGLFPCNHGLQCRSLYWGPSVVASLFSLIKPDDGFDPQTIHSMGEAFEAACKSLGAFSTDDEREEIASRIIRAARAGERDPARLLEAALGQSRR